MPEELQTRCKGLGFRVGQKEYNVTINGLLPGPFLTDRLRSGIEYEARRQNTSFDQMLREARPIQPDRARRRRLRLPVRRPAGFIVSQNLLLDGGAFNSTMG